MKIYREITVLESHELFVMFSNPEAEFNYPLHNHPEYEINLIMKGSGNRIVGDKIEKYEDCDLVLLGPYLSHTWDDMDTDKKKYPFTHSVVIQFSEHLFDSPLLSKSVFSNIKRMLSYSVRGMEFFGNIRRKAIDKILQLSKLKEFESAICFLELLQLLAGSDQYRLIASSGYSLNIPSTKNNRLDKVYAFIMENHHKKITASEVSEIVNLSKSTFSHLFKKSTGRSFIFFLTEIRLAQVCKLLLETPDSISEICFRCGFTNLSNFNRLFKKYKGMTPQAYRKQVNYKDLKVDGRFRKQAVFVE